MRRHIQMQSVLGFGLMFSLLLFAPEPSFAGCRNSGGSSGSNSLGSQVNGGSVTICASAIAITPARTAVVSKIAAKKVTTKSVSASKTVAKPVAKAKQAVFRRAQAAPTKYVSNRPKLTASKPTVKVSSKVVKKLVSKVVTQAGSQNKTAAAADFSPAEVAATVYPSDQLTVGQIASFTSSALVHYRTGLLLNLPTEVRFTPISVAWDFASDGTESGNYVGHVFSSAGMHEVKLRVVYSVSYRIKGSLAWIAEPDTITLSDQLVVAVSGDGAELAEEAQYDESPLSTLLVGSDCFRRPGTFGCQ